MASIEKELVFDMSINYLDKSLEIPLSYFTIIMNDPSLNPSAGLKASSDYIEEIRLEVPTSATNVLTEEVSFKKIFETVCDDNLEGLKVYLKSRDIKHVNFTYKDNTLFEKAATCGALKTLDWLVEEGADVLKRLDRKNQLTSELVKNYITHHLPLYIEEKKGEIENINKSSDEKIRQIYKKERAEVIRQFEKDIEDDRNKIKRLESLLPKLINLEKEALYDKLYVLYMNLESGAKIDYSPMEKYGEAAIDLGVIDAYHMLAEYYFKMPNIKENNKPSFQNINRKQAIALLKEGIEKGSKVAKSKYFEYMRMESPVEARRVLEEAIQKNPNDGIVAYHLASVYLNRESNAPTAGAIPPKIRISELEKAYKLATLAVKQNIDGANELLEKINKELSELGINHI